MEKEYEYMEKEYEYLTELHKPNLATEGVMYNSEAERTLRGHGMAVNAGTLIEDKDKDKERDKLTMMEISRMFRDRYRYDEEEKAAMERGLGGEKGMLIEETSPFPVAGTFIGEVDEARAEANREARSKTKLKDIILPLNYANITKPGTTGTNCEKLNIYNEARVCKECGMGLYEESAKGSGLCDCCFIDSEIQGLTNEYLKYVYVASRDSNGDMNKYFGFRKWVVAMTNSMASSHMEHGWGEK